MEIHIEKVGLIRLNPNPKNKQLTLNLDWSVDYENTDQKVLNYDCILKNYGSFDIKLKVEGRRVEGVYLAHAITHIYNYRRAGVYMYFPGSQH